MCLIQGPTTVAALDSTLSEVWAYRFHLNVTKFSHCCSTVPLFSPDIQLVTEVFLYQCDTKDRRPVKGKSTFVQRGGQCAIFFLD
uniref:Uncharacterized protein n=1 Tax=Anguilla anguilla TaxID=7936 RepID=A0A0E9WI22_ANGAN